MTNADPDAFLRVVRGEAAAAQVLRYLLGAYPNGEAFRWSVAELEQATGLRPGLVLGTLAVLVSLGLLSFSRGTTVRLEVQRIVHHAQHPELPPPSPRFSTQPIAPLDELRRLPPRGDPLIAPKSPTPDDLLAGLLLDATDRIEADLRSLEEADDNLIPEDNDADSN